MTTRLGNGVGVSGDSMLEDVLAHVERYAQVIDHAATDAADATVAADRDRMDVAFTTIDLAAGALRDLVQRARAGEAL